MNIHNRLVVLLYVFALGIALNTVRGNCTEMFTSEAPEEFKKQLSTLYANYLDLAAALVESNPENAMVAGKKFNATLKAISGNGLDGNAVKVWSDVASTLKSKSRSISKASDLEKQRAAFSGLSNAMYKAVKHIGLNNGDIYYQYCPMAFNDKGAFWLSSKKQIANPYFGDKMLRCGITKETIK